MGTVKEKENEADFKAFFDTIDDIIVVGTPDGRVLYSNKAATEKLGFTQDELSGMHILDVHAKEHREEAEKIFTEMFKGERNYCPLPLKKKDGTNLPVETRAWFGKWGGKDCIYGISKDLSKQQAALEKFQKIFDNNPTLMVLSSVEDERIKDVNIAFSEVLGYSKSEVIGKTSEELGLFVQPEKKTEAARKLLDEGRIKAVELEVRKKDGGAINGLFSGEIIHNQTEKSFLTVMVDITNAKKAEKLLELNEKMLSAIAISTKELLVNNNYYESIAKSLILLGEAIGVDRVYLWENRFDEELEEFVTDQKMEWNSGYSEPQIDNPELQGIPFKEIELFVKPLSKGEAFAGNIREFGDCRTKDILEMQNILSILVLPIFNGSEFWGFVGFDECKFEKTWTEVEISLLSSFANSVSKAIERKSMEDELGQAKHAAEKANNIKNRFIANMSHEIRTPMNGILGFLQLIERTCTSDEQKSYVDSIKASSNILLSIVNDILDISKIEAGKLGFEMNDFSIRDIIGETVSLFNEAASKNGINIGVHIEAEIPKLVNGDMLRFKQVIMNLLSNAIKFTERGEVLIEGVLKSQTQQSVEIQFVVKDTGIGIQSDKIGELFTPFTQVYSSSVGKYGGTGLGLYICKNLIEMMNGNIWVKSVEGEGSSFYFTVILSKHNCEEKDTTFARDNNYNEEMRCLQNNEFMGREKDPDEHNRILLVEDNESNRRLFVKMLENKGLTCDVAENGEQAIKACTDNDYDIIFMDCQMPIIDGYEATKQIRTNEAGEKHSVIIAMTASAMKGDKEKCIAIGMDEYVSKPIDFRIIEKLLEKYSKSNRSKHMHKEILKEGSAIREYFDAFLDETGISYEDAYELFVDYINSIPKMVDDMELMIKGENYAGLTKLAHQLKGSAANFRIGELYATSKKIEGAIKLKKYSLCKEQIKHIRSFISINF